MENPMKWFKKKDKPNDIIKPKYISKPGFIKARIRRGFTEIMPLYYLLKNLNALNECFICGGYVRYMCSPHNKPTPAGDIDIYFANIDVFMVVKDTLILQGLIVKHENDVSLSFSLITDANHDFNGVPPIQLIKPITDGAIIATGTMQEILENFDFTVIRCGLIDESEAIVDADFMNDEEKKILRIKNIHCPISSTLRCMKYARKGYWLPPMQCCRLFIDWEERDEEYRAKIIEFLTKSDEGEGLTREDIEQMERLMRID